MSEWANPQDAQRRADATTAAISSTTMTYTNSNSTSTGSRRRAKRRSQLLSKAQHIPSPGTCPGAGERAPLSPQRSFRLNRLTGQESPKKYERLSQRRLVVEEQQQQQADQQQHDLHSASSTEAETSSIEEPGSVVRVQQHQSSSGSVSSPPQTQTTTATQPQPVQQHAAARRIQRVSRQWSNKQKVRRQAQLNEFQRLQKKQEEEYKRIERIRARSKHEPIRTSLKQYQKTVQTNQKYYGFTEGEEVSAKPVAPQRRLSKDDLDVKDSSEEDNTSKQEDEEEEKSITLDQLQQDQECEKFLQKMPLRRRSSGTGSKDSTLSSLKLTKPQTAEKSNTITTTKPTQQEENKFPVPNEIIVSPKTNLEESEISLQASWDNLHAETRWEAQPPSSNTSPKKKQPDKFERIIFRRPVPAILKKESENDRYAVHPRTVYGKPKTKKAIQPYDERWAAQRKQQQKFPTNASRWAAQPKKNFPVNVSRMPKRKKSDENNHHSHSHCRMPKRQESQDDTSQKTPPAPPRRGRRRRRSLKELPNNTNTNTNTGPPEQRGVNRTRSLGEVKQMVSATRIQALFRKYREQQHYRMKRQTARKQEIERELQSELEDIHASLRLRQESIRNGMERAVEAGVWEEDNRVAHNQDELIETLKEQVAELEQQKSRLLHQCDRVRAHNQRLESGNKARETAVKEVQGRLAKLQQIQSKLNKVKENFQNEYVMTSAEMDALNDRLISESRSQERTLECIREVMDHVRPILDQRNPRLLEELEDLVVGLA